MVNDHQWWWWWCGHDIENDVDDQQLLAIEGSKKVATSRALDDGMRKMPVKQANPTADTA